MRSPALPALLAAASLAIAAPAAAQSAHSAGIAGLTGSHYTAAAQRWIMAGSPLQFAIFLSVSSYLARQAAAERRSASSASYRGGGYPGGRTQAQWRDAMKNGQTGSFR